MLTAEKRALREKLLRRLDALSDAYIAEAGAKMTALVTSCPVYQGSRALFIYVSTAREPDTAGMIGDALRSGKAVYVPKCLPGGRMKAIRIKSRADLSPGFAGILEPVDGLPEVSPSPGEIDLAIIPCAGAARDGRRLGRGGGYYDRFLAETRAVRFCLCFEKLLSGDIPTAAHDVRMDYIATENEIIRCGGA